MCACARQSASEVLQPETGASRAAACQGRLLAEHLLGCSWHHHQAASALVLVAAVRQPSRLSRQGAGSLFALEVLHRTGMQFFEVATFAVFCGVACLVVFRGLAGEAFGAVWVFKEGMQSVEWHHVVFGEPAWPGPVPSVGARAAGA